MNRLRTLAAVLVTSLIFSAPMGAQSTANDGGTAPQKVKRARHREHQETESERQVRELSEKMAAQQAEIDALKAQISGKDAQVTTARQTAADAQTQAAAAAAAAAAANSAAAQASSSAAENSIKIDAVSSSVAEVKTATATDTANQAKIQGEIESPMAFHYKGITITPVAFFAFENVYRERSVNSDINTPFNSIPLPSANEGHVSELNFSGRQSRLGALFQADAGNFRLSGYFEGDFLSSGTTSNGNQSNSYTLRQRQFWAQAALQSGFTITGGQMWSLVTETGRSTDNRSEKLPNSIDAQYTVGFNWTRQPGVRLQQTFGDVKTGMFTAAMSLENAQITNFTAASATSGAVPANYFFSGAGANGGLYNNFNGTYANNVAPDVIVKGTYDLPHSHFELGGIARFLRDYYYPIVSVTGTATTTNAYTYSSQYTSNTKVAGGIFGSARVSPSKFVDVAVQAMAGTGVGRYGSAQLADATLRPDGTLEPIRNYHGLFTLETHPTPKLDVYAYYGDEYAQRTVYTTATGALMGYGTPNLNDAGCYALPVNPASSTGGSDSPVSCSSPTRYIQEGLIGATYRFVNNPRYGRLQYAVNYQYIQRNLWSGGVSSTVATAPVPTPSGPRALDNMFFTSLRYYIP